MAKITKPQLVEKIVYVRDNAELEKDVIDFINYNVTAFEENNRNVTMEDLKDTIAYIEEVTGKSFNELQQAGTEEVEEEGQSIIPVVKEEKKVKLQPKVAKETATESKTKPQVTPKEKPAKTKSETALQPTKHQTIELLASFPQTLESKVIDGTLKLRTDLKNIQEVVEAYNNEEDIVLATYWTKRHLKQYAGSYDPLNINPNKPKEFEHDLDLIELTFANDLVVTGTSLYTYVPQVMLPKDFEVDETGMRYANGCEFQIYEILEA